MSEPKPAEKEQAIALLMAKIPTETLTNVRMVMQNKQTPWHHAQHFSLGIMAGNILREAGFKWTDVYIDDHWHELVESAARRIGNH